MYFCTIAFDIYIGTIEELNYYVFFFYIFANFSIMINVSFNLGRGIEPAKEDRYEIQI